MRICEPRGIGSCAKRSDGKGANGITLGGGSGSGGFAVQAALEAYKLIIHIAKTWSVEWKISGELSGSLFYSSCG